MVAQCSRSHEPLATRMSTVFVGPIEITVSSDRDLSDWLVPFVHYVQPSTAFTPRASWRLTVSADPAPPALLGTVNFSYQRHQLIFTADPKNSHAHLQTKGHEADFLAGLELCMCLACEALGGFAVHGAAAIVNRRGWLMPGPSGTGKSTAASLGGFEQVIGDERILLLPISSGGWYLQSTPFWSRGKSQSPPPIGHPIEGILRLEKETFVDVSPIRDVEALESLVRNIVYYGNDANGRERLIENALSVVSASAHYRLGFHKDGPWAWTLDQMHSNFSHMR